MSIQVKSRSLMMRHHRNVINRERAMLARTAAEVGVDIDPKFHSHIQGKAINDFARLYDRSTVAMS